MGRKGGRERCPYDRKTILKTRKAARRTLRRLPDKDSRMYWCKHAGGYHVTRMEASEYDRRQARKYDHEGVEVELQQEEVVVQGVGRGGDCPTCGWLHGFHDPILHSYHEVPSNLTWKAGQPAPWEERKAPVAIRIVVTELPHEVEKPVQWVEGSEQDVASNVADTLSVLKGLSVDDLF